VDRTSSLDRVQCVVKALKRPQSRGSLSNELNALAVKCLDGDRLVCFGLATRLRTAMSFWVLPHVPLTSWGYSCTLPGGGMTWSTFVWRHWGRPRRTSVFIGASAEIRIENNHNTSSIYRCVNLFHNFSSHLSCVYFCTIQETEREMLYMNLDKFAKSCSTHLHI
jgi:hypothetical protein